MWCLCRGSTVTPEHAPNKTIGPESVSERLTPPTVPSWDTSQAAKREPSRAASFARMSSGGVSTGTHGVPPIKTQPSDSAASAGLISPKQAAKGSFLAMQPLAVKAGNSAAGKLSSAGSPSGRAPPGSAEQALQQLQQQASNNSRNGRVISRQASKTAGSSGGAGGDGDAAGRELGKQPSMLQRMLAKISGTSFRRGGDVEAAAAEARRTYSEDGFQASPNRPSFRAASTSQLSLKYGNGFTARSSAPQLKFDDEEERELRLDEPSVRRGRLTLALEPDVGEAKAGAVAPEEVEGIKRAYSMAAARSSKVKSILKKANTSKNLECETSTADLGQDSRPSTAGKTRESSTRLDPKSDPERASAATVDQGGTPNTPPGIPALLLNLPIAVPQGQMSPAAVSLSPTTSSNRLAGGPAGQRSSDTDSRGSALQPISPTHLSINTHQRQVQEGPGKLTADTQQQQQQQQQQAPLAQQQHAISSPTARLAALSSPPSFEQGHSPGAAAGSNRWSAPAAAHAASSSSPTSSSAGAFQAAAGHMDSSDMWARLTQQQQPESSALSMPASSAYHATPLLSLPAMLSASYAPAAASPAAAGSGGGPGGPASPPGQGAMGPAPAVGSSALAQITAAVASRALSKPPSGNTHTILPINNPGAIRQPVKARYLDVHSSMKGDQDRTGGLPLSARASQSGSNSGRISNQDLKAQVNMPASLAAPKLLHASKRL